ncbi:MAG: DUF3106 domain-containing protein [Gammaproteobacteria bacterium]|nr:DUF3106 domain-containing protein [Gammaproteobacteria bacterium]
MKPKSIYQTILGCSLVFIQSVSWAALPEPPDPREVPKLTFEQRIEKMQKMQALSQATMEEKKLYREKLREKLLTLKPEERTQIRKELQARWQSLDPEQREQIHRERVKVMSHLTPEERAEIRHYRQELFGDYTKADPKK